MSALSPGDAPAPRTIGPLGVHEYVRYQAASGDLNPIHHDRAAAEAAGFDDVFCPGMLSAGLLGSYLADVYGAGSVREIGVAFREIVRPGEALTCRARVVDASDGPGGRRIALELSAVRPDGSVAVTGDAVCVVPEADR